MMSPRSSRWLGAMMLVGALGCSSSDDDARDIPLLAQDGTARVSSRGSVDVDIRAEAPVRVGKNTLSVTIEEPNAELTAVSALMPAHGHGSPAPAIAREGSAFVVKDLVFFMPGRWELRLVLQKPSGADDVLVALDVP